MNCNTQLDPVNLTEPTKESFRPCDPRDNRNLPESVFEERNLGFCRHRETAATQITRTYEAQARAAIEIPNVHHALEAYDLYPHILTEGKVTEFKFKGLWHRVLVLRTFSNPARKIEIEFSSGRIIEVNSWALSWRDFFVSDPGRGETTGDRRIRAKCCPTHSFGYVVPFDSR